jgi:molecular chaperone DnaK
MGKVVGIDLGTTYSAIAVVNDYGKAEILPNREGERITPSVILFDDESPLVGSIAKRSAAASPDDVIQLIKRQMGNPAFCFPTDYGDISPEEASAVILKRLAEDASTMLGEPVTDAVITVPAYFNDAQRKSTMDAGEIAGLNVLRIINEPTAAALAYGIEKTSEPHTILVYDLGGGTFDVTIMRLGNGKIEVLATDGDKNLGGFDWDNESMNYLNDQFQQQGGIDLLDDAVLALDLREKAELAKKTLSSREKVDVFLSGGGNNARISLTRETFQQITAPLLSRTQDILEVVLDDAGMSWSDIDKILLVGGSTRMPAVTNLIEQVTGKKPSLELHPDEVVAMGAAFQASLLEAEKSGGRRSSAESLPIVEIEDVTSHGMGVVALNDQGQEHNSVILKKNAKIPCKVSERYSTVVDNQTALQVQITLGDSEIMEDLMGIIGESTMPIPPYPAGAPVEVFFQYDANGVVQVEIFDCTANKLLGTMEIERRANKSVEEIRALKKKLKSIAIN